MMFYQMLEVAFRKKTIFGFGFFGGWGCKSLTKPLLHTLLLSKCTLNINLSTDV